MPLTKAGQVRKNMTFGSAVPTASPSGTSKCPVGRVRIGVFFDGTNNNAWRDWGKGFLDWKPQDKSSSKAPGVNNLRPADPGTNVEEKKLRGPTTIARLYYLFEEKGCCQKRIYATGVGGGDPDMKPGDMFKIEAGVGLGGRARVDWGIECVTEFVNNNNHHLAIEKRIDTFGFSRGATQARDFLNKILTQPIEDQSWPPWNYQCRAVEYIDPKGIEMCTMVKSNTYPAMKGILFEYLGITDTVASEGFGVLDETGDVWAGYNLAVLGRPKQGMKPKEILGKKSTHKNVIFKEGWVHRTYHQVADDEFRAVFALELLGVSPLGDSSTGSCRDFKHLPENMREQSYPGCHADIGGGYRNSPKVAAVPALFSWLKSFPLVGDKPEVPPKFINISNLTLQDMYEDAHKAGVPLNEPKTLPEGLHEIDPDSSGVPKLSKLYEEYCQMRATLIKQRTEDYPKWGWGPEKEETEKEDKGHDIIHAPVYIHAYPGKIYEAITKDLRENPKYNSAYKELQTYYVHDSKSEVYRFIDSIHNAFQLHKAGWELYSLGKKRGRTISRELFDKQREVHYHGFQNSYDHHCDNGKSKR